MVFVSGKLIKKFDCAALIHSLLIIAFLLTDSRIASAQLYSQTKVIPPSPEASSLFKFSEVPVSYFTGLANTTIPLFEVKAGNMVIPVNLSYHGRGVRVDEIAPRVGIGWSLNYGGMISRQARGKCDDGRNGYLLRDFYNEVFTSDVINSSVNNDYAANDIDLEPDMFMFDMPGLSGKFMFDQTDRSILLQSYSDTRIVPIWIENHIEGWIVTDKEGNTYYFGLSKDQLRKAVDYDLVHNYSFAYPDGMADLGTSDERPINTWHLMEIETASNDVIQFSYNVETAVYYKRQYDKNIPDGGRAISYFGKIFGNENQIREISFRGGKIKFTRSATEREDIQNAYALEKVELFDRNDSLVKAYTFQYEYPATVQDNNHLNYLTTVEPRSNKRLFLHSIQETGKAGTKLPPYFFTYSNVNLPNRFSNSQDAWGYYNGAANGEFLTFFQYGTHAVNREVDTVKAEAGLLKKITYPTGGSVSFIYEHNRALPPDYMNQLLYPVTHQTETVPVVDGFLKNPIYYIGSGDYIYNFKIPPGVKNGVSIQFQLPFYSIDSADQSPYNYVVSMTGNVSAILFHDTGTLSSLNLPPGNYQIKVHANAYHDPSDFRNLFVIFIRYNQVRDVTIGTEPEAGTNFMPAAGKRIKRIIYRNPESDVKIKEFDYTDPATGKSSGKLLGLPNFYYIQQYVTTGGVAIPVLDKYGSIPGSPLTNLQGNGIGYAFVTEYFGTADANTGKIEYKFTTTEDGGDYYKFPYHLPIDNEWLRGKILNTKIYENTGTGYDLKKETVNKYAYAGEPEVEAIFFTPFLPEGQNYVYSKTPKNFYLPLIIFTKDTLFPYNFKTYYQTGGVMDMYQTIEREYTPGGIALEKQTDYSFDYSKHYQSTGNTSTNSKGDSVLTKLYYPADLTNRTATEQKLINLNRIAAPIKVESIVKRKATDTELSKVTTYNSFGDWGSNILAPQLVQSANNNNPLENDVQFFSYNKYGNPTELAEKDGVHVVYLWGYSFQYPVAKVVGSDYNTVKNLVDTTMLENAYQYTDVQIRNELNKIRTGLAGSNVLVSTYTYKPLVGMTSETDPKGRTVFYEYDELARLVLIRDHENNIVKKIGYNYVAPENPSVSYSNVRKTAEFTRTTCGTGTPNIVTYEVPAGTYTSYISQFDADQQAQDEINANGQTYANKYGGCTFSSVAKSGVFTRNNCGTGTGSSVTYTVDGGAYTSGISQEDADQQAQNDVDAKGQGYANEHGICTYSSVAKSGVFTRNNCTGTATGNSITYTVDAGAFTSTISQEDADQKAQNYVNANGQDYANTHAGCTQVIYATIQPDEESVPVFEFGCLDQYQDIHIKFWQDAAHTIPYSVTNLTIQVRNTTTQYVNGQVWGTSYTDNSYTCNGASYTLSQQLVYHGCASNCPENTCLPKQTDPHSTHSFTLPQSTFSIIIP